MSRGPLRVPGIQMLHVGEKVAFGRTALAVIERYRRPGSRCAISAWLPADGRWFTCAGSLQVSGGLAAGCVPIVGFDHPEKPREGGEPADPGQRAAHVRAVEEQPLPVHLE